MKIHTPPWLRFIVTPDEDGGGGQDDPDPAPTDDPPEDPKEDPSDVPADDPEGFDSGKALEKIKKLNSENANLRKRAKASEEKAGAADTATQQVPALEAEILRYKVGLKHGLPEEILGRLKGTTEEELLTDAESLLALFSPKRPPTNRPTEKLRGGTDPTSVPEETDVEKLGARMFRR